MEIREPISSVEQLTIEDVYMVLDDERTPATGAYGVFLYRGQIKFPGEHQIVVSYIDSETMKVGDNMPYDIETVEKRIKEGKIVKVNLNKTEKNKYKLRLRKQ